MTILKARYTPPTMHPVTLRFSPREQEQVYWSEMQASDVRFLRILTASVAAVLTVNYGVRQLFMENPSPGYVDAAVIGFLGALLAVSFSSLSSLARPITLFTMFGFGPMVAFVPVIADPAAKSMMFGYVYVALLVFAAMPVSIVWKAGAGAFVVACYLAMASRLGLHSEMIMYVQAMHMSMGLVLSLILGSLTERGRRRQWILNHTAIAAVQASDALLDNVLPPSVGARLRENGGASHVVDDVADAVVLFADLVGFTSLARARPARDVAAMLDGVFSRFDVICEQYGVEKIKTIGDAYMCVAGIPTKVADPAGAMAEVALDFRAALERYRLLTGEPLALRIGIHGGRVAAGIIGRYRFLYDLWGDTVNVAARLEATARPGEIQVSAEIAERLGGRYACLARGRVELKGIGEVETFLLAGRAGMERLGQAA